MLEGCYEPQLFAPQVASLQIGATFDPKGGWGLRVSWRNEDESGWGAHDLCAYELGHDPGDLLSALLELAGEALGYS